MAFLQSVAIWDAAIRPEVHWLLLVAGLSFMWLLAGLLREGGDPAPLGAYGGLFGPRPKSSTAVLKSQYARQMRQVGAQEERNRLARDLHDSVKQQIFAIQTAAATAETRLAADPDGARAALTAVRGAARDSMAEMDAMLDQLRATPLENAGLVDALRQQCEAVRIRTSVDVACEIGPLPPNDALPPGVHLALLRAAQEALSNAARHARASHVRVAIGRSGGRLELTVADDGKGFAVDRVTTGMGLRNIRERAAEFGGEAHIGSTPAGGTTVFISIPFEDANPTYYRNRAGVMLAVALFFLVTTISRWPQGRGRFSLIILTPILLDGIRYLVAWRRAAGLQRADA
jgi:signal transduction histidine kinase